MISRIKFQLSDACGGKKGKKGKRGKKGGKDKGKDKGAKTERKIAGNCCNCGKPGHTSHDCRQDKRPGLKSSGDDEDDDDDDDSDSDSDDDGSTGMAGLSLSCLDICSVCTVLLRGSAIADANTGMLEASAES